MNGDKKKKAKLITTIGTAIASLGLMVAGAFASPEDILEYSKGELDDKNTTTITGDNYYHYETIKQSLIEKIPLILRAIIGVPLWLIGSLLIKLFNGVLKIVLSPIISFLLGWLFIFLLLLGIILLCLKLIFPNKKLKELINKKLIITVHIGSLIIRLSQIILPKIWSDYSYYEFSITLLLGLIVILIVLIPALIKKSKEPKLIIDMDV